MSKIVKKNIACRVRKAVPADMNDVFRMGKDTWGADLTEEQHLEKCHASKKYPKGQWYVLEDEHKNLLSSTIIYTFPEFKGTKTAGFGTIATLPKNRKHGYASYMIQELITTLSKFDNVKAFYLYSDINPRFYEKFGFVSLPEEFQKYLPSVAMIHCDLKLQENLLNDPDYVVPDYF